MIYFQPGSRSSSGRRVKRNRCVVIQASMRTCNSCWSAGSCSSRRGASFCPISTHCYDDAEYHLISMVRLLELWKINENAPDVARRQTHNEQQRKEKMINSWSSGTRRALYPLIGRLNHGTSSVCPDWTNDPVSKYRPIAMTDRKRTKPLEANPPNEIIQNLESQFYCSLHQF